MSNLKWWQKGIGLSVVWIGLVFGVMWLHTGAKNDRIDNLYGQLGGMVLGAGWVIAAICHSEFWRQRVLARLGTQLSWKKVLLYFAAAAVVLGFLVYRDLHR